MTRKELKQLTNSMYDVEFVPKGNEYFIKLLINKCINIFEYINMPPTVNKKLLEFVIFAKGVACVTKINNRLVLVENGSAYGYDYNMIPNEYCYSNPIFKSGKVTDRIDGAMVFNTTTDMIFYNQSILFETIERYANLLSQLESTICSEIIAVRKNRVGVASNQNIANSVDTILDNMKSGNCKTLVNENFIIDNIKGLNFDNNDTDIQILTNVRDYLLNCFYNEIGLETLEEKKERMIVDEVEANEEVLHNNIQDMFNQRVDFVNKLNALYKTDIQVVIKGGVGI